MPSVSPQKPLEPGNSNAHRRVVDEQTIANMKARVAQCRRVAAMTHNPEIIEIMLRMATEGDADIKRLEQAASNDMPGPLQAQ